MKPINIDLFAERGRGMSAICIHTPVTALAYTPSNKLYHTVSLQGEYWLSSGFEVWKEKEQNVHTDWKNGAPEYFQNTKLLGIYDNQWHCTSKMVDNRVTPTAWFVLAADLAGAAFLLELGRKDKKTTSPAKPLPLTLDMHFQNVLTPLGMNRNKGLWAAYRNTQTFQKYSKVFGPYLGAFVANGALNSHYISINGEDIPYDAILKYEEYHKAVKAKTKTRDKYARAFEALGIQL